MSACRASSPPPAPIPASLTLAELRVAARLGTDGGYVALARALGLSPETVRTHVKSIYRKLGVRSRHAAVARLLQPAVSPGRVIDGKAKLPASQEG